MLSLENNYGRNVLGAKGLVTAYKQSLTSAQSAVQYDEYQIKLKLSVTIMSERDELDEDGGPSTSKRSKFGSAANADCQAVTVRTPQQSTERILASELDERIFTYVSNSNSFSFAKFGFLKLGPLCNASESHSFTEANCHVKTVRNENNLALILEFSQLFSRGVMLLSDVKNNRRELDRQEIAAIKILDNFFKEKGKCSCTNSLFLAHLNRVELKWALTMFTVQVSFYYPKTYVSDPF